MKPSSLAVLLLALLPLGLWLQVLDASLAFHAWAVDSWEDSGSVNAHNDWIHARRLLFAALAGTAGTIAAAAWLAIARSVSALVVGLWLLAFGGAFWVGDHAHPIAHFPTGVLLMLGFWASAVFVVAALVAAHLACRVRRLGPPRRPDRLPA
jgi:hypothetical protein